jgi:hypothetical protein
MALNENKNSRVIGTCSTFNYSSSSVASVLYGAHALDTSHWSTRSTVAFNSK